MSNVLRSCMAKALTARGRGVRSVSSRNFSSYLDRRSGKQTISLADESDRKMMGDIRFAGYVFVGGMSYYVKGKLEYVPIDNATQEYVKMRAQTIKQVREQQQAIKEQAKASAGPEE